MKNKIESTEQQIKDILHKYFAISINQPLKEIMEIIKQKEGRLTTPSLKPKTNR